MTVFPEYVWLKETAETAGFGDDLFRFNEAAVHDYLSFKNAMESMSQDISKAIESRIKEAEKVVE